MSHQTLQFENIKLGIVCPMANEEATAVEFVNQVLENCRLRDFKSVALFAIFDKACTDNSHKILKNLEQQQPELQTIYEPANTCVVDAYVEGYRQALSAGCDWILEIDGGFSHQPYQIPAFLDKMSEGYDCIFGSRFIKGGQFKDAPLARYFISRCGSMLANLLLGTRLKDMTSGFELFTADTLQAILDKGIRSKGHFFQTEIKARCGKLKIAELPIEYSSPSQAVNNTVLMDAFANLFYLFRQRITGNLYIR
jgi:dolichol-phosphate mannosyltransferase